MPCFVMSFMAVVGRIGILVGFLLVSLTHNWKSTSSCAFTVLPTSTFSSFELVTPRKRLVQVLYLAEEGGAEDENDDDQFSLSSLFEAAKSKGVVVNADDLEEDDEEGEEDEDDDEEDEEETNFPQGAINAFLGYDTGITNPDDTMAGNVSLTNDQLYSEVKERVLDTAGGFVDLVRGAQEDDDDDDEQEDESPKPYQTPSVVPDSELTAGEVVLTVLEALKHNDVPYTNRGVEVFFGYSSSGSQVRQEVGLTPAEYADFWKETEYNVLFHQEEVMIDKGQYSFDGKKAFFTARLRVSEDAASDTRTPFSSRRRSRSNANANNNWISINFILSVEKSDPSASKAITTEQEGSSDDDSDSNDCWMIDSLLIRPQSMQRRRR